MEPEVNDQLERLGARDTCHLHITNSELRLLCAKDGRLLVAWPFTCLRRYMSKQGKFTVEAGRRAPTGEGKFTFLTPQHDEIYKLLDNVVKSRASHKPSTSSHESLRKTQSVPIATAFNSKDMPENGYDHLATTPKSSVTDHQLSPRVTYSMKNTYSSPYGHLPSRDVTKTGTPLKGQGAPQVVPGSRLSVESEESDQYNTLTQPAKGAIVQLQLQQGRYAVGEDGYNILEKHLPSSQDGQDTYNVLDHGPKPRTTSQHQQGTDDVYNMIGETLHPVTSPVGSQANEDVYNTLSTSQRNTEPLPTTAPEETYNTLDHGSLARSPHKASHHTASTVAQGSVRPPKLTARKLFEPTKKQPSSVLEGGDSCNKARHPPRPPARKTPEQAMLHKSESVDEGDEVYNTLDMSKSTSPAPSKTSSEQLRKLQKSQSLSVAESSDMYNTLDTATKVVQPREIHMNKQTALDSDEMYNRLAATRVGSPPIPAQRKSSSPTIESNDMYNTLGSTRAGPMLHSEGTDNVMSSASRSGNDMYNMLDTARTGPSLSVPVPPQRAFLSHGGTGSPLSSPGKRVSSELKRNSTSTMQSVRCPLDASPSLSKTRQETSSLDDLDSYASIDYVTLSPPKGAVQQPPIPTQRSGLYKGRKTSAPDVLSFAGYPGGKEFKKPVKSGLVSNLKASLEAGGLDVTKLQRKPKKLSREGSEELCPYAEVDEQGDNQAVTDEVFVSGTSPTRPSRSQSSPSEAKPGEDIYDELDQTAQVRPKSLQITKPKKNAKK